MSKHVKAETKMEELDKEQVDTFMKLVHHTIYSVIQHHENETNKPFQVRDDMDMLQLTSLAHQAVDVTINTLFELDKKGIEIMKKKLTVIDGGLK